MRIEEITSITLVKADNWTLHHLRERCVRVFNLDFKSGKIEKFSGMTFRGFLSKYVLLRNEMRRRNLRARREEAIDEAIGDRLYKQAIWGLDVPGIGDIMLTEAFVAVAGSYVKNPKAEDATLEVVVKAASDSRSAALELQLRKALSEETAREPRFVYSEAGPGGAHIPIFDLVLRARPTTEKAVPKAVRPVQKKLTEAEQADYDRETDLINENIKKPEASRPHKFAPAKWTAMNGHPRCLVCGDEEPIGGICNKEATKKDVADSQTLLDAEMGKAEDFDISKPYPNEHACRLAEPENFSRIRAGEREHDGKRYRVLYGQPKDGGGWREQAYRYPKDMWGADAAKAHCAAHGGKFEAAVGKCEDCSAQSDGQGEGWFKFVKVSKHLQLVGGIIYEPNTTDTQGDFTDAPEIEKAMLKFMENYAAQTSRIKVMHKGKAFSFPIVECFQPEQDTKKGGQVVKAGSWWMTVKITDADVWQDVLDGKLQGFSMGGRATSPAPAT
jgi:hypothetical protein